MNDAGEKRKARNAASMTTGGPMLSVRGGATGGGKAQESNLVLIVGRREDEFQRASSSKTWDEKMAVLPLEYEIAEASRDPTGGLNRPALKKKVEKKRRTKDSGAPARDTGGQGNHFYFRQVVGKEGEKGTSKRKKICDT